MSEQDNIENLDSPNETTEEIETLEETEDTEDNSDSEATIVQLKEKNKMLFARAKRAEGFVLQDGKWIKPAPKPKVLETKEVQPTQNFITKDEYEEGILRTSKGYGDDDINVLKVLSKGKGISILQAEQDPMFKLHLTSKAEEEKKSKAQLGASKGSGANGKPKGPLTREEHMAMVKERLGQ